jgi:hypothetical protein
LATFGVGKGRIAKRERNKAVKRGIADSAALKKSIEELKGIEKLESDIGRLKSTIKLCKSDLLQPSLRNNEMIIMKQQFAEKLLDEKIKELEEYNKYEEQ